MSSPSSSGKDDYVVKENSNFCCWYCNKELKISRSFAKHLRTRHNEYSFGEDEGKHISTFDNFSCDELKDYKSNDEYVIPSNEEFILAIQAIIDEAKTLNQHGLDDKKEMPGIEEHKEVSKEATTKEVSNHASAKGKEIAIIENDESDEDDSDDSL
ncbi:uncharacterized protein G2W53_005162 [Senna tora]|uniref:C2H2-type domain-containing protein n=1 Tax=Senna tora TaxID=362788 RepID=A0A835CHU9_9FABA|nr:uncharacterized protein G2W53_005162 [Senna tora]